MKIKFLNINPNTVNMPKNYIKVDKFLSRSAQPLENNIDWLKKEQVTDIIDFCRDNEPFHKDFNEKKYIEDKNMKYHNISSYTNHPQKENIEKFLNIVNKVKQNNGKLHIHCREGADRTGMYTYVYERLNKVSTAKAYRNFINGGWHKFDHPHLAKFAEDFIKKKHI